MNLTELQKEAHAIAQSKGWWDGPERSFGDLIALVHSELSEALEAYRKRGLKSWDSTDADTILEVMARGGGETELFKPEGVPSELADVVIRVADMAEWYGVDLRSEVARLIRDNDERPMDGRSFGEWLVACHASLSFAYASREWDGFASGGFPSWEECLADCVAGVKRMAEHYGIDLDAAIEAKMEYHRGQTK